MDNPKTLGLVVRSRPTILEILENRGYDVDAYKGIHPEEIYKLDVAGQEFLKIIVNAKPDLAVPASAEKAIVLYWIEAPVRLSLESQINKYITLNANGESTDAFDPTKHELIIIVAEPPHDVFHNVATKLWNSRKIHVSFFQLENVICNPARHAFVPPHRKLGPEESAALVKGLHLTSKYQLPNIKYHVDMQARVLGLVPGDIVEISRPSESSGIYTIYRVCAF